MEALINNQLDGRETCVRKWQENNMISFHQSLCSKQQAASRSFFIQPAKISLIYVRKQFSQTAS